MKNILIKIAIALFLSLFIFISMIYYYDYKRHKTFHICSHGHEVHTFLFEQGTIGAENIYEIMKDAFNEDTAAIKTFASMDVRKVLDTYSGRDKYEKRRFCEEYRLSLHTLIDKIGQRRFIEYCKHLPREKKAEIKENITMELKFDFDYNYHNKYKYVIDNL